MIPWESCKLWLGYPLQNGRWPDVSKHDNDGIITGGWWEGDSLEFDGIDDSVNCGMNSDLNITTNITVLTWIKAKEQDNTTVCCKYDYLAASRCWRVSANNVAPYNLMTIILSDDGSYDAGHAKSYTSSIVAFDSKWHLIGFTFNTGTLKLYIDGVEDTACTKTRDDLITSIYGNLVTPLLIAAVGSVSARLFFIEASFTDLWVFNKVMVAEQIKEMYEHTYKGV